MIKFTQINLISRSFRFVRTVVGFSKRHHGSWTYEPGEDGPKTFKMDWTGGLGSDEIYYLRDTLKAVDTPHTNDDDVD